MIRPPFHLRLTRRELRRSGHHHLHNPGRDHQIQMRAAAVLEQRDLIVRRAPTSFTMQQIV